MPCNGGDDTFKGQPFFLRSAEDYREGLQSVPRTDFGLSEEGHSWAVQTVDHQTDQHLEWLLQAPLDKAPSGWAGRRRPLDFWIRLAGSLEETKRERERWVFFFKHFSKHCHGQRQLLAQFLGENTGSRLGRWIWIVFRTQWKLHLYWI